MGSVTVTKLIATPYWVMTVDGLRHEFKVQWPEKPDYDTLRTLVEPLLGGFYMEHVSVLHEGQARDMFVDQNGRLKELRRNEAATKIYRSAELKRRPKTNPEALHDIRGPAVLFMRRVWW
jgi:hypothetical protein